MNDNNTVGAMLLSSAHPYIAKHTNLFSILISLVIMLLGIVSIGFALCLDNISSTVSMLLLTLGSICLLISLYRLFWRSQKHVYTLTGSAVVEGSCYWDSCDLQNLQNMLEQSNFKMNKGMSSKLGGNVRLDYVLSKDYKFAAVQLFQFVPYVYEPVTRIYYYTEEIATDFARHLIKNKL